MTWLKNNWLVLLLLIAVVILILVYVFKKNSGGNDALNQYLHDQVVLDNKRLAHENDSLKKVVVIPVKKDSNDSLYKKILEANNKIFNELSKKDYSPVDSFGSPDIKSYFSGLRYVSPK